MKITKYVHSCLLVETLERVALFDPGVMSTQALNIDNITTLDDIFITHIHQDHIDEEFMKRIVAKFPDVRITSTEEVVKLLAGLNISASNTPPEGVTFFDSPHELIAPLYGDPPQEIGIHYLDTLSDPGDSHSFHETKTILALPMTGPWGHIVKALNIALELKPKHVLPIHDWHWSEDARKQSYARAKQVLADHDITFHELETGVPVEIDV